MTLPCTDQTMPGLSTDPCSHVKERPGDKFVLLETDLGVEQNMAYYQVRPSGLLPGLGGIWSFLVSIVHSDVLA